MKRRKMWDNPGERQKKQPHPFLGGHKWKLDSQESASQIEPSGWIGAVASVSQESLPSLLLHLLFRPQHHYLLHVCRRATLLNTGVRSLRVQTDNSPSYIAPETWSWVSLIQNALPHRNIAMLCIWISILLLGHYCSSATLWLK